jgi:hypothetical protein
MVANAVMDKQVRALWVSMAQTWTKLDETMESGYSRIKGRGRGGPK